MGLAAKLRIMLLQETFFTPSLDGSTGIYDLRMRFNLVEPGEDHKVNVKVSTPSGHVLHSVQKMHSYILHRVREQGVYTTEFSNPMSTDVTVEFDFEAISFGHRLFDGKAAADVSLDSTDNHKAGVQQALEAKAGSHIALVRFSLDEVPSEYALRSHFLFI